MGGEWAAGCQRLHSRGVIQRGGRLDRTQGLQRALSAAVQQAAQAAAAQAATGLGMPLSRTAEQSQSWCRWPQMAGRHCGRR